MTDIVMSKYNKILNIIITISLLIVVSLCLFGIFNNSFKKEDFFLEQFNKNKYKTLSDSLKVGNCKTVILYYMSYSDVPEIKNSLILDEIKSYCEKNAYYTHYLYLKSLSDKDLEKAQKYYYQMKELYPDEKQLLSEQLVFLNKALSAK